jgi:phosphoribosylamine---glycine ligase
LVDGVVQTNGGRVLAVSAVGEDFDGAFATVYGAIEAISFAGCYSRRDIGYQVRTQLGD